MIFSFALWFDDEGADTTAFCDDILSRKRLLELEHLVDVIEDKVAIFIGNLGGKLVNTGICGADAGFISHGNHEEKASIVGEEGEDFSGFSDAINDEMDAFGEEVAVLCLGMGGFVVLVSVGATGVDEDFGGDGDLTATDLIAGVGFPETLFVAFGVEGFDIIGGNPAMIEGFADEAEDEAGIVINEVSVRVFKAALAGVSVDIGFFALDGLSREKARRTGEKITHCPVQ